MIIEFKKKHSPFSTTYLLAHIKLVFPIFLFLILIALFFLDKPFLLFFQTLSSSWKLPGLFLEKIFSPLALPLLLPTLFFYVRFVLGFERKSRALWYLSLAIPLSIFSCRLLNLLLGRATPEWFFLHQEIPFRFLEWNESFHSFPSLSACTISAFFASLSCLLPPKRRSLFSLLGFLLPCCLLFTNHSFFSDILAGIFLGTLSVQWIFKKMKKEL